MVIGCGESGILAGIRLTQANIGFTIIEKNAGPGGTRWENNYPGAGVDVAYHFYCFSFEPNNDWKHFFAEQPELAPRAVEETMRYAGAVRGTGRFASEDIEYRGVLFPAGTFLSVGLAEVGARPVTAQATVPAAAAEPARVTVKVNGVLPVLPSALLASVAAMA